MQPRRDGDNSNTRGPFRCANNNICSSFMCYLLIGMQVETMIRYGVWILIDLAGCAFSLANLAGIGTSSRAFCCIVFWGCMQFFGFIAQFVNLMTVYGAPFDVVVLKVFSVALVVGILLSRFRNRSDNDGGFSLRNKWICQHCTLINDNKKKVCTACGYGKNLESHIVHSSQHEMALLVGGGDQQGDDSNYVLPVPEPQASQNRLTWICQTCTLENPLEVEKCTVCGRKCPEDVLSKLSSEALIQKKRLDDIVSETNKLKQQLDTDQIVDITFNPDQIPLGMSIFDGGRIFRVIVDGYADMLGIQVGWVITKINGQACPWKAAEIQNIVNMHQSNGMCIITFWTKFEPSDEHDAARTLQPPPFAAHDSRNLPQPQLVMDHQGMPGMNQPIAEPGQYPQLQQEPGMEEKYDAPPFEGVQMLEDPPIQTQAMRQSVVISEVSSLIPEMETIVAPGSTVQPQVEQKAPTNPVVVKLVQEMVQSRQEGLITVQEFTNVIHLLEGQTEDLGTITDTVDACEGDRETLVKMCRLLGYFEKR